MHSFIFNVYNAMNDTLLGKIIVEEKDQDAALDKAQFIAGKRVYLRPA